MNNQFSKFKYINWREAFLGLVIAVGTALLDLAWQGANPVIIHLQETQIFDFSLFTAKVNLESALDTATIAASIYYPTIFFTGKKEE